MLRVVVPVRKAGGYRTVRSFPDDEFWREVHRIADHMAPRVKREFLAAINKAMGTTSKIAIENALADNDLAGALKAIDWVRLQADMEQVKAALAIAHQNAARMAAGALANNLSLAINFNLINSQAVIWAEQHAAARITQGIVPETRKAIGNIIVRGQRDGVAVEQQAKLLYDLIGLNDRQAGAVYNQMQANLKNGMSAEKAGTLAEQYAERLRQQRATNIARTETLDSANAGQRDLWKNAAADGLLDPMEFEREWIAVEPTDGRTCPTCIELDGKKAPLDGGTYEGGYVGPTAHTDCRCTERLTQKA